MNKSHFKKGEQNFKNKLHIHNVMLEMSIDRKTHFEICEYWLFFNYFDPLKQKMFTNKFLNSNINTETICPKRRKILLIVIRVHFKT